MIPDRELHLDHPPGKALQVQDLRSENVDVEVHGRRTIRDPQFVTHQEGPPFTHLDATRGPRQAQPLPAPGCSHPKTPDDAVSGEGSAPIIGDARGDLSRLVAPAFPRSAGEPQTRLAPLHARHRLTRM